MPTIQTSPAAAHTPAPGLQGPWRRVVFVTLYELIAIAVATAGLAQLTGQGAGHSGVVAGAWMPHGSVVGLPGASVR